MIKIMIVRREVSCGVLLFQERPRRSFLLLLNDERIDIPKGRMEDGESELECALRELEEETGIAASEVRVVEGFRSVTTISKPGRTKQLVIFAAEANGPLSVVPHDHDDYAWVPWDPPHTVPWPRLQRALDDWHQHVTGAPRAPESIVPRRARRAS